jgi:hypothetical protein
MAEKFYLGGDTNTTALVEDDKLFVEDSQDAEPILDYAKAQRDANFSGSQGDFTPYMEIPETLAMEWMRLGLNIMNPVHFALLEKKIRAEYPKLLSSAKLTDPRIIVKGAR